MKKLLLIAATLAVAIIGANAQTGLRAWATGGTQWTNTGGERINYAVGSAYAAINGGTTPVAQFISVTSDKAGSVLQFYAVTNFVGLGTNTTGTNIQVVSGTCTGALNTIVLIRHLASDTYDRSRCFSGATNAIVLDPNEALGSMTGSASNTVAGDVLYFLQPKGSVPVGNTTVTLGPGGLVYSTGLVGLPLYMEVTGNNMTNTAINCASGVYQ